MTEKKGQYRMPKGYLKGKPRRRGAPILHDEVKEKLNLTLTPTTIANVAKAAKKEGLSRSELIERWSKSLEPCLTLTQSAITKYATAAAREKISCAEFIERLALQLDQVLILTPAAITIISERAAKQGITPAEVVERWARKDR